MARPQIKLEDLGEDWKGRMLELAHEGASIVELSVELGISRDTFYALMDREPKFSDTVKQCKALSEAWWERQGRTNLMTKEFNYTGWYMNMKNRFKWTDRQDVTSKGEQMPTPILGGTDEEDSDS